MAARLRLIAAGVKGPASAEIVRAAEDFETYASELEARDKEAPKSR